MSRRCPKRHRAPTSARFCPECWALLPPARPPVRRRVFWPLVTAGVFGVLILGWWAFGMLADTSAPKGPVARAQPVLPAVLTMEIYDSLGAEVSQGSGFLVDSTGRAITAFHVLQGAYRAAARLEDGRLYDVLHVEAWDSLADIALFHVGRSGRGGVRHPPALRRYPALRTRVQPKLGEPVVVVGSPEGFTNTLSDGVVSGMRYTDEGLRLQLTAPISSGSSGGPVFDGRGRVLGVVVSRWADGQNLNFATPAASFAPLMKERLGLPLAAFGERTREEEPDVDPLAQELFVSGNEQFERKRYVAALERYRLALQADSTHSSAAYNAAMCLVELDRDDEAERYLRQYLRHPHEQDEFHRHALDWLAKRGARAP